MCIEIGFNTQGLSIITQAKLYFYYRNSSIHWVHRVLLRNLTSLQLHEKNKIWPLNEVVNLLQGIVLESI